MKFVQTTNAVIVMLTILVLVAYASVVVAAGPSSLVSLSLGVKGTMVGFEDGTMRWEQGLTRAQAAKVMATAMDLHKRIEDSLGVKPAFPDVPSSHWAFGTVNLACELGLVKGFPDGTFKPDAFVTKAEYAVMLSRVYAALGGIPSTGVSYAIEPKWAADEIFNCVDLVSALRLSAGDSLNYQLTRGEAAIITYTLMDSFGLIYDMRGTLLEVGSGEIVFRLSGMKTDITINIINDTKCIYGGTDVPLTQSYSGKEARIILDSDGNCALIDIL